MSRPSKEIEDRGQEEIILVRLVILEEVKSVSVRSKDEIGDDLVAEDKPCSAFLPEAVHDNSDLNGLIDNEKMKWNHDIRDDVLKVEGGHWVEEFGKRY